MIIGVGIDMIEIARIADRISGNKSFIEKVFSEEEVSYCESQADKFQHYAARFAAKEAFLKATGEGLKLTYDLSEIAVKSDGLSKPEMQFGGSMKVLVESKNWKVHVSLTHLKEIASAVVIIESQ